MKFRILGPVEIWRGGMAVSIVGEKQRTLVAHLVLRANQAVSHDELLRALWGDTPPASGRRALHNHVWSVRRLLSDEEGISTSSGGYTMKVPARGSDLGVFGAEVAAAHDARAANDLPAAAERLRTALDLWRGPALTGTRMDFQIEHGYALEEMRLAALTDRIEVDLALGRQADLIGELRQLVVSAPLRERFRGQLMLALYREGRRADALEEYRLARRYLRDELGIEPGEELARIHHGILAADPELMKAGAREPAQVRPSPPKVVPRQLPVDVVRFTGREESLAALDTLLSEDRGRPLVISAIAGAGGVGKTALATHWGHLRADRFPDGQLYVNLHGYSHNATVTSGEALRQLLRGLGVEVEEMPLDTDERSALYRSILAGKNVLVLLDNAATADQVRPLLPGSSSCRAVITSRSSLRGLAATHDVDLVVLDVLQPEEAESLLRAFLREDGQSDESIRELAALCGYLPLALRLAAARLRDTREPVADLVGRLRAGSRLAALEFEEDPHSGVRSTFALSYQTLPVTARSVFRAAGLHPGPDISLDALAAMTGQSSDDTREAVSVLVRAHLVHSSESHRVSMHDLIREYARELSGDVDLGAEAMARLLGWHAHTARSAMTHVDPDVRLLWPDVKPPPGGPQDFADRDSAMAWLNNEHRNTVAIIAYAAHHGSPVLAWQLAYVTAYHFYLAGQVDDWIASHQSALEAARQAGDLNGETRILTTLAHGLMEADRYGEFLDYQRMAVELAVATDDIRMQAEAQFYVAFGLFRTGQLTESLEANALAQELYRAFDHEPGEIATVYLKGQIYVRLGRMQEALDCLHPSLKALREQGRQHDEAHGLLDVCTAYLGVGKVGAALESVTLALSIARELGDRVVEALALCHLGEVRGRQGLYGEAFQSLQEALAHAQQLRRRLTECKVHNGLGRTYSLVGDREQARKHFRTAMDLATKIDDVYELEAARAGLG
ncbi:BTAD domain-containing putative transcriptional regulator [Nonomuraea sp. NPDC050790]|uniref:AfsR/SARP family transcriptional regulator n=1 Tax=Nonomuraea sp. NPDC050790 TaxID=3364371 RepID=UPI003792D5FA